MVHYILPALAILSGSAAFAMLIGRFIERNSTPAPDECEQMARIAETTIAKEEAWIPDLQSQLDALDEKIGQLEHERCVVRKALTMLNIRKEKAEAAQ